MVDYNGHLLMHILHMIVFFFWVIIVIACAIVDDACYTILWPTMTTPTKFRKPYLEINILIHCKMWWGKRWEFFFYIGVPLSKTIITTISWTISCVVMCSFLNGLRNKCIFKSWMVCPHLQFERCAIVECGKLGWVCDIKKKWIKDKQNASVVGWVISVHNWTCIRL
jgi:hypothetical protein